MSDDLYNEAIVKAGHAAAATPAGSIIPTAA